MELKKELPDPLKEGTLAVLLMAIFLMGTYAFDREGNAISPMSRKFADTKDGELSGPKIYIQLDGKGVYTFPPSATVSLNRLLARAGADTLASGENVELETGSKVTVGSDMSIDVGPMDGEKLLLFHLPIDINRAEAKDFEALPGIGKIIAQRIIEVRALFGSFKSIDDLKRVKGIGSKKLRKIKGLITTTY